MGRKLLLPCIGLLVCGWCLMSVLPSQAQGLFSVHLDTSPLIGAATGSFSLDFQLIDGSGIGDGNNTATLSNFQFGMGGAPSGSPSLLGDATGDLASTVGLGDTTAFSEFAQSFTPGDALRFGLQLTNNPDMSGISDQFAFAILDGSGTAIPTEGPGNALFTVDLASGAVQAFGTSAAAAVTLAAPTVRTVPEPSTLAWLLAGLLGWATRGQRRRRYPQRVR
ncbi:MAG TPA: NF038129 family PEP-CTERM protein [Chthonomonadaceae bacterium]|nr:NF038129 family PEP-CTERM protein [Chthonomonadaceae bacterium]